MNDCHALAYNNPTLIQDIIVFGLITFSIQLLQFGSFMLYICHIKQFHYGKGLF